MFGPQAPIDNNSVRFRWSPGGQAITENKDDPVFMLYGATRSQWVNVFYAVWGHQVPMS